MATVACVFDTAPAPRRPHDIIHPPGGRSESRTPRPGPKAERKWCTASVIRPPERVIADAFDQAQARDPQHLRDWIVLVDGARKVRGYYDTNDAAAMDRLVADARALAETGDAQ